MRQQDPFIINEPFVALLPTLVTALKGDVLDAAIVQLLWNTTDCEGESLCSVPEIVRRIGAKPRTVERHLASLQEREILTHRLSGGPGSRSAWMVHCDAIPWQTPRQNVTPRQSDDTASMAAPSPRQNGGNDTANVAVASYKKVEEVDGAAVETETVVADEDSAATDEAILRARDAGPFPVVLRRQLTRYWTITPEQAESWCEAWRSVQALTTDEVFFSAEVHLSQYLIGRKDSGHIPTPARWVQFFTQDRAEHVANLRHRAELASRSEEDPWVAEHRANRMPAREWNVMFEEARQ